MMFGFGMGFFWILIVALIVVAVLWAMRGGGQWSRPSGPPPPDPHRILDERFARGEIDEEEYRRRRETLSH